MSIVLYDRQGPNARKVSKRISLVTWVVFALLLGVAFTSLFEKGYFEPVLWLTLLDGEFITLLFHGLVSTFTAALTAMFFSLSGGALIAFLFMSQSKLVRSCVRLWIEFFRGIPLLLLIFFIFLGGPALGLDISTFWSLVIGLSLFNSVVIAEIFRAGILSLPKGQAEAAYAIGLSRNETFRVILLPQAIRRMAPSLIAQLIVLLKETSFGFIIGYTEFLRDARTAVEFLGDNYSLSVYTLVAIIYFIVNWLLSLAAKQSQKLI
ncbi:amino acid ABC transporter permease (plasmid) [Bartonella sp. HY329]|uniref:amino acid ABC transporter permease n=1 Tax=unclassified Bartonella TaxID=2645622 RepID=UPI0021C8003A|nr:MULTISPECIES: amino acid ABC transporter permease [unclassified Bartonella]UXM96625.1 amino acid ABC transporter permease [Bartonella sp. HY329]UXN10948.1 amino acid ABC transporter permease [Bartonella sp. HY328]